MSVPKIVEITYVIYQGLSKRRLYKEYVGRKVNNSSGFNLRRNFAFACTPTLSPKVVTWLEPAIQSKNPAPDQQQTSKNRATSMSS